MEFLRRFLFAIIVSCFVMGLILGGLILGPSIIEWFMSLPELCKFVIIGFFIVFIGVYINSYQLW